MKIIIVNVIRRISWVCDITMAYRKNGDCISIRILIKMNQIIRTDRKNVCPLTFQLKSVKVQVITTTIFNKPSKKYLQLIFSN